MVCNCVYDYFLNDSKKVPHYFLRLGHLFILLRVVILYVIKFNKTWVVSNEAKKDWHGMLYDQHTVLFI